MKKLRQMLPRAVILASVVALIIYCLVLFLNSVPSNNSELITNVSFIEDNRFIKNTAIPIGNGSWLYDEVLLEQDLGDGKYWQPEVGKYDPITSLSPGLFAGNIFTYNAGAKARKKINQLYSYATTPETSCKIGKVLPSAAVELLNCSANDRAQWDTGEIFITRNSDQVMNSSHAYLKALTPLKKEMNSDFIVIPVVDARLDQRLFGLETYIDSMNYFNQQQAEYLAEKTAALFCTSNEVPSVQFDIEPFNFNHFGQAFYYQKLAYYFSGQGDPLLNDNDEQVYCKNAKYPHGRSWSVFTFPDKVTAEFSKVMNHYGNGYVIIAGYDMENPKGAPAGIHNDVDIYRKLLKDTILETLIRAQQQNFYYKIAIPAAASVHEFNSLLGQDPKGIMQDGQLTAQFKRTFTNKTLDYTKAAIEVINESYVVVEGKKRYLLDDPKFIGIDLWGWTSHIRWPRDNKSGQTEFSPSYPPQDVLQYLQDNLPVSRYYFNNEQSNKSEQTAPFTAQLTVSKSNKASQYFSGYKNAVFTANYLGLSPIDNVKFYHGEQLLAEDDHLPYQYIINSSQNTPDKVTAKAFYKNNLVAESIVTNKK